MSRFSLRILMALYLVAVLAQCGGEKSKASKAEFTVLPEKPIVITADTLDPNGNKVSGPWFEFGLKVYNGSDESFTLVAFEFEIVGTDENGTPVTKTESAAAGAYSTSILIGDEDVPCNFTHFGTWGPGESNTLLLEGANNACYDSDGVLDDPDADPATPMRVWAVSRFLIGSNPKPMNGNYRYRVTVRPAGWFGSYDNPTDRFETKFRFSTR